MMNATREKLVNRVAKIYGADCGFVTMFAGLCERLEDNEVNEKKLTAIVTMHEKSPMIDHENEEE